MVIEGAQLPIPIGLSGMNDDVSGAAILTAATKRLANAADQIRSGRRTVRNAYVVDLVQRH